MKNQTKQQTDTPYEGDEYWELFRTMNRLYWKLEKFGLDCFNEDGSVTEIDGNGCYNAIVMDEHLTDMLEYFEKFEWYNKCAFLLKLQTELRERTRLYKEEQMKLVL